jgi:hypothetical protein
MRTALPDLLDRDHGALLGLAVGDALGTTLEFTSRWAVRPVDDMVGGGPCHLDACCSSRTVETPARGSACWRCGRARGRAVASRG